MELPSQEGEMPIPLNSSYGGGVHIIHHDNTNNPIIPSSTQTLPSNGPIIPSTVVLHDPQVVSSNFNKKTFKYRECLKNHAASMGGNATDGCGEFMPSGEEGTIEALTCSACNCHRNFHRKEIEGEVSQIVPTPYDTFYHHHHHNVNSRIGRKIFVGHHHNNNSSSNKSGGGYNMGGEYHHHHHRGVGVGVGVVPPSHQMIMSYNVGSVVPNSDDQSDEQEEGNMVIRPPHLVKKRFRTKFTQEQKEKMLNFAERVGWKIQKQEEGVVQQFCAEIGVKRRVLKVWMHNNKHSLGKKNNNLNNNNDIISQQHMMTNVVEGNQD